MQLMRPSNTARGRQGVRVLSAALFLGSVVCAFMVGERGASALWQWYKFIGYPTPGVVTLSLNTGLWFSASAVTLLLLAVLALRASRRRSDDVGAFLSKSAIFLYVGGLLLYWLIALSPLNLWRP